MAACSHLDQVQFLQPREDVVGCEDCLETGSGWGHLRMCHSCGKIRCCDSSPIKHATRHANEVHHPLMRSVEPNEDWSWSVVDQAMFVLTAP